MAQLSLRLLGPFQAHRQGVPVTGLKTDKARALLAYLAARRAPQQRAHLAGLLWPDWPEATARTYVRQALANLREALEDQERAEPILLATRQWIQVNPAADVWVDVLELSSCLQWLPTQDRQDADSDRVERLHAAVGLYHGRFLEGFFLDGCSEFEEWQLLTGEQLQRQVTDVLLFLIHWYEVHGALSQAQQAARRCVEIEPLMDEPHRHLIRLLALNGEPSAALAHYAQYQRLLADELDVPPPRDITTLAEQIRVGQGPVQCAATPGDDSSVALPPFLAMPPRSGPTSAFVARERELDQLATMLTAAISGAGSVVFVVGDAGQGKTALLREFTRRALDTHPQLLVVGDQCSSYGGLEDPFLPFRTILAQLTGDLEAAWSAGAVQREEAQRLWATMPVAVEAVLDHGPDLVGTLLSPAGLRARVDRLPSSTDLRARFERLETLRPFAALTPGRPGRAQFDQVLAVLRTLARRRPLLLWLDDLHWADLDSIALLFYLGQHLANSPILVVGAYRPEEVATRRDGDAHPLHAVVQELQRQSGYPLVDLNRAAGQHFVDAYLDVEPNRLTPQFRTQLCRHSGGHPLFTVELLRAMQEGGDLVRDGDGYWKSGPALRWQRLPTRVEAVISRRIAHLSDDLRRLLTVASVQGERFSAEIVAAVLGHDVQETVRQLSRDLERQHLLVRAEGIARYGDRRLTWYRFRHGLFQTYLREALDPVERSHLHEAIVHALEAQLAEQRDEFAGQLAWHCQAADMPREAIHYLLVAGQRAMQLSAYQEALEHLQQGLALLNRLPAAQGEAQLELDLLIHLARVQAMVYGGGSAEVEHTLLQMQQISRQLGATPAAFQVLCQRWEHYYHRSAIRVSWQLAQQCLDLAERIRVPVFEIEAHIGLGSTLCRMGHMTSSQQHLAVARELADAQDDRSPPSTHGINLRVNCRVNEALPLWYLGYADQARRNIDAALALAQDRADQWADPYSLVFALVFAAGLSQRCLIIERTRAHADALVQLSAEHGFTVWGAAGSLYQGWTCVARGEITPGLAQMRQSLSGVQTAGTLQIRFGALLADAHFRAGDYAEAKAVLDRLRATIEVIEEHEWEAEVYRLQGATLLALDQDREAEAETCFEKAIAVARAQQAKSLELRATLSLSHLWRRQGKCIEAYNALKAVYEWFTEGFDTPDLQEAHAFLSLLSKSIESDYSTYSSGFNG